MITVVQSGGNAFVLPYEILQFKDRSSGTSAKDPSFIPLAIRRCSDNIVFRIGDRVCNGEDSPMCGKITAFTMLGDELYVDTTYSGVGMNMGSLIHVTDTLSRFQRGDMVAVKFESFRIPKAVVIAVHHGVADKIKYDLQIWIDKATSTRIYGIDGDIVEEV